MHLLQSEDCHRMGILSLSESLLSLVEVVDGLTSFDDDFHGTSSRRSFKYGPLGLMLSRLDSNSSSFSRLSHLMVSESKHGFSVSDRL